MFIWWFLITFLLPSLSLPSLSLLPLKQGADVFNALDLMDNAQFLEELKFGTGDGHLRYYLYNWKCPEMPPEKAGVVTWRACLNSSSPLIGWTGFAVKYQSIEEAFCTAVCMLQ